MQQAATNNRLFSNYVQSVSFALTLSRTMIDLLGMVRDCGGVEPPSHRYPVSRRKFADVSRLVGPGYSSPMMLSLEKRGLIFCNHNQEGLSALRLTRAGELTCDLLVEANLLAQKEKLKAA